MILACAPVASVEPDEFAMSSRWVIAHKDPEEEKYLERERRAVRVAVAAVQSDAEGEKQQALVNLRHEIDSQRVALEDSHRALIAARRETEHEIQRALDAQRGELEQERRRVVAEAQREASEHEARAIEALRSELDGERQRAVADAVGAAREEERARIEEIRRDSDAAALSDAQEAAHALEALQCDAETARLNAVAEARRDARAAAGAQHAVALEEQRRTIDEQRRSLDEKQRSIDELRRESDEKRRTIDEQRCSLEEKQRAIDGLRRESDAAAMSDAHDADEEREEALEALRRDAELAKRQAVAEARRDAIHAAEAQRAAALEDTRLTLEVRREEPRSALASVVSFVSASSAEGRWCAPVMLGGVWWCVIGALPS